jgi:hypothetical protein
VTIGTYEDAQDAAAAADSHDGLRRTNEDKRKVVNMLIRMERHMDDSDRVIANIAGVDHKFVGKLRRILKKQLSVGDRPQLNTETKRISKPEKRKGKDGKLYRTDRKKPRSQGTVSPPPPPLAVPQYTPEQIGWPAPEIADLPHPDHPGYTHAQWFIHQHGHVHTMPVKDRELMKRQITLREFSSAVNRLGKAANEFAKVRPLEAEEYFQVAATMDNGGRMWIGKLAQHLDLLLRVLRSLEEFSAILKERDPHASQGNGADEIGRHREGTITSGSTTDEAKPETQ